MAETITMKSAIKSENRTCPVIKVTYNGISGDYSLCGEQNFGRRSKKSSPEIWTESATVSRIHGLFTTVNGESFYTDMSSTNGTYRNGRLLAANTPERLRDGDILRVRGKRDPEGLMDVVIEFFDHPPEKEEEYPPTVFHPEESIVPEESLLDINIRERNVTVRSRKITLLRDIRLEIPSKSMVLILGGSGAGKTTFMNAVMGYEPADGTITYRGMDIYDDYDKMKYEVGYVPQQDLLRMNDSLYDTVLNAAGMRLPAGMGVGEYRRRTDEVLRLFSLDTLKDSLVGKLSGGQRKRLSIAVEYIGNPSLFFLDEPDSGLDGTTARSLMENLREIADAGKTVLLITHSPDRVRDLFDRIIVLAKSESDESGRLAFYGTPNEALDFFSTDNFENIVARISREGEGRADEFIQKFNRKRRG